MTPAPSTYILAILLILLPTAFLRLLHTLPTTNRRPPAPRKRGQPTHLLITLGSGGHTAEMLSLLHDLSPKTYTHRSYVVSSGDGFSAGQAEEFERAMAARQEEKNHHRLGEKNEEEDDDTRTRGYSIHTVPRARHIHQPLLTTPLSSLHCLISTLHLLHSHPHAYPSLILTNGPATSLIVILAATILRYFSFLPFIARPGGGVGAGEMRVIYVESWARVKRPSLSGRIVVCCGLADRVLVQWKRLEEAGWGEYGGVLVR